jgi:3-methyl-2-oxobutanoate hydroxymethyltransferase
MSSHSVPAHEGGRKPVTLTTLRQMHARGERIAMLTCYDSSFAQVLDEAGVDCLLVGDSLGMVLQGKATTLSVTIEEVAYHTRCAAARSGASWLIADLPFGSYHAGVDQALKSSAALMQAGAHMVKLEGGGWTTQAVRMLVERGIPVCAHLGLTPQSVHALGGFRVQGRTEAAAALLRQHARELHGAGAAMLVLELVPAQLSAEIQADLPELITIGIGAGPHTAGQVLVLHDMLGITRGKLPRFVKNFMADTGDVSAAVRAYVAAVKQGHYPEAAHHAY